MKSAKKLLHVSKIMCKCSKNKNVGTNCTGGVLRQEKNEIHSLMSATLQFKHHDSTWFL